MLNQIDHAAFAAEHVQVMQEINARNTRGMDTDPVTLAAAQALFTQLRGGGLPDAAARPLAMRIASIERNGVALEFVQQMQRMEARVLELEKELHAQRQPHLRDVERRTF